MGVQKVQFTSSILYATDIARSVNSRKFYVIRTHSVIYMLTICITAANDNTVVMTFKPNKKPSCR